MQCQFVDADQNQNFKNNMAKKLKKKAVTITLTEEEIKLAELVSTKIFGSSNISGLYAYFLANQTIVVKS